ncbi:MAG: hypothetical protein PHT33_09580 [bacterium]|nr:hypothetical protein [bacterium]
MDEYGERLKAFDYCGVELVNGHYYSIFPVGTPLLAVPGVWFIDRCLNSIFDAIPKLSEYIRSRSHRSIDKLDVLALYQGVELIIASVLTALVAVVVFFIACCFTDLYLSVVIALIFAFCTPAWSTASRALWQHGPSMLMLSVTLYLFIRAREKPTLIQFAGIPLLFSYVIRPTNSISIVAFSCFVAIKYRKHLIPFFTGMIAVAVPFILFNLSVYHSILSPYYLPQRIGDNMVFVTALAGNLISPARGLFVFSPILLFSLYGIMNKIKSKRFDDLDIVLVTIIVLHWFVISSFSHWWGGHSFGPRFFTDMMPYFMCFIISIAVTIRQSNPTSKYLFSSIFIAFALISFAMHYRGANDWSVFSWNSTPVNVDCCPERLWDWHDTQFLRR